MVRIFRRRDDDVAVDGATASEGARDDGVPDDELSAPGWDAIDDALRGLYGDQVPRHTTYYPPMALSDNLQGCSAYAADGHWHYVTYGLSELYEPGADDDPEISGWGFELTMRVAREEGASEVPAWPFAMLNEVAKHVNGNLVLLESGHRVDFGRAITGHPALPDAPPTSQTVLAFGVDAELGEIATPHGRVVFLQAFGVTPQEKELMLAGSTADVLADLSADNPLLVVDPRRAGS